MLESEALARGSKAAKDAGPTEQEQVESEEQQRAHDQQQGGKALRAPSCLVVVSEAPERKAQRDGRTGIEQPIHDHARERCGRRGSVPEVFHEGRGAGTDAARQHQAVERGREYRRQDRPVRKRRTLCARDDTYAQCIDGTHHELGAAAEQDERHARGGDRGLDLAEWHAMHDVRERSHCHEHAQSKAQLPPSPATLDRFSQPFGISLSTRMRAPMA